MSIIINKYTHEQSVLQIRKVLLIIQQIHLVIFVFLQLELFELSDDMPHDFGQLFVLVIDFVLYICPWPLVAVHAHGVALT